MAGSLDCARDDGHIVGQAFPVAVLPAGRQECLPYKLDPSRRWRRQLQPQASWNQNAIEQIEKELDEQRQQRRRNCAFQDCHMIIQIEPANDWFA